MSHELSKKTTKGTHLICKCSPRAFPEDFLAVASSPSAAAAVSVIVAVAAVMVLPEARCRILNNRPKVHTDAFTGLED